MYLDGGAAVSAVVDRLTESFGVPVDADLPVPSAVEWSRRPAWMRTEPWRTLYYVDAMLDGFTRPDP